MGEGVNVGFVSSFWGARLSEGGPKDGTEMNLGRAGRRCLFGEGIWTTVKMKAGSRKPKRRNTAGKGFGRKGATLKRSERSEGSKKTNENGNGGETEVTEVTAQETRGGTGVLGLEGKMQTPHKVIRKDRETLEEVYIEGKGTMKEEERDGLEERLLLQEIEENEKRKVRWKWEAKMDERIQDLRFAMEKEGGKVEKLVAANRDLIGYRLLYRLTSKILWMESEEGDSKDEGKKLRELRKKLVDIEWEYDREAREKQQAAEKAVQLSISQGSGFRKDVENFIDGDVGKANAIWLTVYAAIAAWEERKSRGEFVKQDLLDALKKAASELDESKEVQKLLTPILQVVQRVLTAVDQKEQAAVTEEVDEPMVEELGILMEQIRLYPTNQYRGLCERLMKIYDYLMQQKFGVVDYLDPVRFQRPKLTRESRLTAFSRSSRIQRIRI